MSFANFVVPTVLTIVVTPIVVHYLGADYYGIFVLAGSLMAFISLVDLGIAPALMKFVSEYASKHELSEINALMGVSLVFYAVVGCIATLISLFIAVFFLSDLFDLTAEQQPAARFALVFAGLAYLVSVLLGTLMSVPAGLQRFGVSVVISIGLQVPVAVCTVLVAAGFSVFKA